MERELLSLPVFIGTILVLLIFSPTSIYAQEDQRLPSILPDSPFYGIKLAIENIQEAFTFQDARKAELILKHAEERDLEALALERDGKEIPLVRLKEIQADKIMKAEEIIIRLDRAQNIVEQRQQVLDDRSAIAQATTEQERIQIQRQQQLRDQGINLIETTDRVRLIELDRPADRPIKILPVEEIFETDSERTQIEKLKDRLENAFSSSELTEIRAKFSEIRNEEDFDRKKRLAESLDEQINNPLVSISCFGRINTLSIAVSSEPVKTLQDQCVILRAMDTELLTRITTDSDRNTQTSPISSTSPTGTTGRSCIIYPNDAGCN